MSGALRASQSVPDGAAGRDERSRDGAELITGVIRWSGDIILAERTQ
jgi:hypothetical protein